jgi:peptidoglycan-N-acetylglucosamine deacetylase
MRKSTAVMAAFVAVCVVAVGVVVVYVVTQQHRSSGATGRNVAVTSSATFSGTAIPTGGASSIVVTVPSLGVSASGPSGSASGPVSTTRPTSVTTPASATASATAPSTPARPTSPPTDSAGAPGISTAGSTPPATKRSSAPPTTPPTTPGTSTAGTPASSTKSPVPPSTSTVPLPDDYQHVIGWVSSDKVVSLTFDDGPGPQTGAVLDVLDRYGIKATFCQIGMQVADYPDIERRITADGHTLCNHSWDHDEHLASKPAATIASEISRTQTVIKQYSGVAPVWYRAPGGDFDGTTLRQQLVHFGTRPLGWGVDSEDWRKPGVATIVKNVLSTVTPGAIILFHDAGGDRSQTLAALPQVIQALKARGYGFVVLPRS